MSDQGIAYQEFPYDLLIGGTERWYIYITLVIQAPSPTNTTKLPILSDGFLDDLETMNHEPISNCHGFASNIPAYSCCTFSQEQIY